MNKLILILFLYSVNAIGMELECRDILPFFNHGKQMHINTKTLDEYDLEKSLDTYLDIVDPSKTLLTQEDYFKLKVHFNLNKLKIGYNLLNNSCEDYESIESIIINNKKNLYNILKTKKNLNNAIFFEPFENYDSKNLKDLSNKWVDLLTSDSDLESIFIKPIKNKYSFSTPTKILKALTLTYDPHSDYIAYQEIKNFKEAMTGNYVGLGIMIDYKKTLNGFLVIDVFKNTPAYKSNLKIGDVITHVNNEEVNYENYFDIIEKNSNKKNSTIALKIKRKNIIYTKLIKKEKIKSENNYANSQMIKHGGKNILHVKIHSFYADNVEQTSSTKDIEKFYLFHKKTNKIDGIIVDLRFNGGGLLTEAVSLTGLFLKDPLVVQSKYADNSMELYKASSLPTIINEPLIVLTNSQSASSSEIFAGALQSYGRGLIVGDINTYGKGTIQMVAPLPSDDYGMLKISIGMFYLPNGKSTQLYGVKSDVIIPSMTQFLNQTESKMRNVLPYSEVASFTNNPLPTSLLEKLNLSKDNRIKDNYFLNKFKNKNSYITWFKQQSSSYIRRIENNRLKLTEDYILKESLNVFNDYLKFKFKP